MTAPRERRSEWDFANVDDSGADRRFITYLDRTHDHPYAVRRRQRTFELLELAAGDRVLEVGCGTGEEVLTGAVLVGAGGSATGLDVSGSLLKEASHRAQRAGTRAQLCVGDARTLPFRSGLFDACRCERTLLYVADPPAAVAEMARVLAPGGRMVVAEPDYETLVWDTPEEATSRGVRDSVLARFPSANVGRRLHRLLTSTGLVDVRVEGWVLTETDFDWATTLFALPSPAAEAVAAGTTTEDAAAAWSASLKASAAAGTFFCAMTAFLATGRKA